MAMTHTNVSAAALEVVSNMVLENLLRSPGLMNGKYIDGSAYAVKGADSVTFPAFTALSAQDVSNAISASDATLTAVTLTLSIERVVSFLMSQRAIDQNAVNFYEVLAQSCADVIKRDWDGQLITTLEAGASAAAPDHQITWTNGSDPVKGTFSDIVELLDIANVPQDGRYVGIHPTEHKALRAIADFMDAEKYGTSNIGSGVIGQIYGLNVVKSTGFTAGKITAWHPAALAGALQRVPTIQVQDALANNLSKQFFVHYLGGAKVLRDEAIVQATEAAS